jgi:hypothetical protein
MAIMLSHASPRSLCRAGYPVNRHWHGARSSGSWEGRFTPTLAGGSDAPEMLPAQRDGSLQHVRRSVGHVDLSKAKLMRCPNTTFERPERDLETPNQTENLRLVAPCVPCHVPPVRCLQDDCRTHSFEFFDPPPHPATHKQVSACDINIRSMGEVWHTCAHETHSVA